ncbi:MAG TPA: ATP-binding cassette domain-containing protein, partial [Steroidobacteraceae bacterium]|nr:ATP-binding cassette domain-containing protein [Steroidobacteraceae bacterium]
ADAELHYGDLPLLDRAALAVEAGERIGLIGRNGTGKSSLLGILAGTVALDDGELKKTDGLRIVRVEQEPAVPESSGVEKHKLDKYLQLFGVNSNTFISGGERKKAALAHALAQEPDLLLLDEPTNHLDLDGILVLENILLRMPAAIVVTHDRAFLDRVATRIVELDRGRLLSFAGNFSAYEQTRAAQLAAEAVTQRKFDRFWAQEEAWIRKGIEARRTRNEGRVRRLERLRDERAARRSRLGEVKIAIGEGQRSGKLVAELIGVSKEFSGRKVVSNLDLIVSRGDRLGFIGPNGAGKTTLLNLILGTLAPDSGTVRLGANVQVAYFDQLREVLDPEKTVAETISPGSEWVDLPADGKSATAGRKHVMSYLGDFLFPPRRAHSKVSMLSGGERNRLLLARLFARPANLVVLDEPTNDLDIESLELLEQKLQEYSGTLLLVSHDRRFLDNVVTQTLAAEGGGAWYEYVGGYSDWLRQRRQPSSAETKRAGAPAAVPKEKPRGKLSFKDQRELAALPDEIEALEREQSELNILMSSPDYHRRGPQQIRDDRLRSEAIDALLLTKFARWESLEEARK